MKKEYVVVSPEEAITDENDFIENFWTQRWDKRAHLTKAGAVACREEYLIMQPFLQRLPSGSCILDGGCGMGAWTVFLTNQGFDVVGLDISRPTIARLKELFPDHKFVCGDIRHTEFPDALFDAYFSWGTFEHFENGVGECINEARRILKPGGFLFISVPFHNWWHIFRENNALHTVDGAMTSPHSHRQEQRFYQWRLTQPELQRELEVYSFSILLTKALSKRHGVTRWMQENLQWLKERTKVFSLVRRILISMMPAWYISHMILAVAQKAGKE